MIVCVCIKIKDHPQLDGPGSQKGDIIEILPYNEQLSKTMIEHFLPVYIDLNIPCGDNFSISGIRRNYKCTSCEDNNLDSCDFVKYKKAIWSAGSIDNPPNIMKKRKYKIERNEIISTDLEFMLNSVINIEDKNFIVNEMKNNIQIKDIIEDKG